MRILLLLGVAAAGAAWGQTGVTWGLPVPAVAVAVPAGSAVPTRIVVPAAGQPVAPVETRRPPVRLTGQPAGRAAVAVAAQPLAAPPPAALAVGAAALAVGVAAVAGGGGSAGPVTTLPRAGR